MGDQLPVKARLVKANNQWGMGKPPLIEGSLYDLMAKGHLNPTITEISFGEIGEGLGRLERHEFKGRLVANLDK